MVDTIKDISTKEEIMMWILRNHNDYSNEKVRESYINLMAGLWRAREGVNMLSEENNRQNQIINEMFFSLNDIIGCLLPNNIQLMHEIERRAGI